MMADSDSRVGSAEKEGDSDAGLWLSGLQRSRAKKQTRSLPCRRDRHESRSPHRLRQLQAIFNNARRVVAFVQVHQSGRRRFRSGFSG